jgi:AcrR family transcriptional regulator
VDERTAVATRRGETYGGRSRQERATDRRDRILAAALHLFGTRAYDDVTVADVCTDAKVSKRYFYEHFADRCELLYALHRKQNRWLLTRVVTAIPEHPESVDDLLRPAIRTLLGLLRDNPERARVIYLNAPRMETARRGVLRQDAAFLAEMLRPVKGHPSDEIRYGRMLLALVAGLSEVIIDWLSRDMADDVDQLADHLTGIFLAVLS